MCEEGRENIAAFIKEGSDFLRGKMKKIKPLMPSEREKKRYLVLECISEQKFDFPELQSALTQAVRDYIGLLGEAGAGIFFLKNSFEMQNQRFIIKVRNNYVDELLGSLALLDNINGNRVIMRSIFCSGTLHKAKEKLINS
ncbi:MAG: ribonuclease protein subunit [Candidatus Woesearchaeota archaeon]|nr:ribonuclease protein subunit [Candidatus Woesearchaeota archaeon]